MENDVFKVKMQSKSGSELFAAADGYPSDWVTQYNPAPEAVLDCRASAEALAALVVAKGYAVPRIVEIQS
jgi:hypothetical protein